MESPSVARRSKRARSSTAEESARESPGEVVVIQQAPSTSRTRAATACVKCRTRKTKCDNQRPACSYCSKIGIDCVYDDDMASSSCAVTGARILDAIGRLSNIVERERTQCSSCSQSLAPDSFSQHRASVEIRPDALASPAAWVSDGLLIGRTNPVGPFGKVIQPTIHPQGLESILKWNIFAQIQVEGCLFAGEEQAVSASIPLPSLGIDELGHLKDKYVHGVHSKNPILDLEELHPMMMQVAENGFDWSTNTCLVALVCAIGAMAQHYQDQHMSPDLHLTPGAPQAPTPSEFSSGCDPQLSLQFWNVAVKRLGFAIGQSDLQAAQCLCLAGIWYMHQLKPLEAWKYFNLAGSVWYSYNLVHHASGQQTSPHENEHSSVTTAQALYFTIWKSICELRLELDVPGIFDNVGLPHDFPLAPNLDHVDQVIRSGDSEPRYWFYYLAEIAARHQINRIAHALSWSNTVPTSKDVQRMLTIAHMLESHLDAWHASLPPMFAFEIPSGHEMAPHRDDFVQILRHRYLTCKELITRPFVRLCVETSCAYETPVRDKVLGYATVCLQYCMLKLSQVAVHRHQGTWFGLRNAAASTLLLCSVSLAQENPWLPASRELELPRGWRERALRTFELLASFWTDQRGGGLNIGRVLQSTLLEATDNSGQIEKD